MKKIKPLKYIIAMLLFVSASLFMMSNASATSEIMASAVSKSIKVTNCQSCHNSAPGQESRSNLKPNYFTAYSLDKTGLTRLKNLINGCPAGQALNTKTFLCEKQIVQSGTVGLAASGAAKTDVYSVTCGAGTSYLALSVKDLAPAKAPLVSIQATKGVSSSPLSTDNVDGDANYSPLVKLVAGPGIYTMKVNKSASPVKGAEAYTAQFSCRNAAGTQTGTTWKITQNQ